MNEVIGWLFGVSQSDFAGTRSWSFRLTGVPENLWFLLGLVTGFALLFWLVIGCYRKEGKSSRRVKMTIAAFRLAVLVLLFLTILQPALVLRFANLQTSSVAVLVDDSMSMRWKDRYSDEKETDALARFLGTDRAALSGENRPSRLEAARSALLREDGLLTKLAAHHPLHLFRFGVTTKDSASYTEPIGVTEKVTGLTRPRGNEPKRPTVLDAVAPGVKGLKAEGYHTHLDRAVREVLNRLEGGRLAAMVIVSDGQNTGIAQDSARLAGAAQMAQQRRVPIFTVGVGDPVPPRNIMVAQLQGPREARQGSKVAFTAFVTHRSLPETTVDVRLLRSRVGEDKWEDTGVSAKVTLGGKSADSEKGEAGPAALQEAMLTTDAPEVGVYSYKARIEPLPEETIVTDNEATALLRVTDQKMSVLLIGGDAGWEFQYLRNYLLKTKDHYAVTVWQQNADARFNQDASGGMKRTSLPAARDELFQYDAIILYDPKYVADSMDERFIGMLDDFVSKHHGGVCYIVGNKYTSKNLAPGGGFAALGNLLPVAPAPDDSTLAAQMQVARDAVRVEVTPAGMGHPMMQLAGKAEEVGKVWKRLPGIYRTQPVLRLKTLATALAVSGDSSRMTQEQQREPLIAIQYYGKGRVLYMGFDTSWRWRMLDDAVHYERFWANALDFLGAGRLEKKRILITTGGEVFDAGSEIQVRAEAYNRDFTPMTAKALMVEMRQTPSGGSKTVTLRQEKPGFYAGRIPADHVGVFELDAKSDDLGQSDWMADDVAVRRIEVRLPQEEFRQPEANYETLRELAGTADRFVPLHRIDDLAEKIPIDEITVTTEAPHTLWNSMFMLMLLGTLLLIEWTLRKLFHMM